jgi:ABC-type multidrug transport system ATPase subunit
MASSRAQGTFLAFLLILALGSQHNVVAAESAAGWCEGHQLGSEDVLQRINLTTAKCVDGSAAYFYDTGAMDTPAHCLVVHLQEGQFCSDTASCNVILDAVGAAGDWRTYPSTFTGTSVLSRRNPQLGCCRRIFVPHCSMDYYSGSGMVLDGGAAAPLYFDGFRHVQGVFNEVNSSVVGGLAAEYRKLLISGSGAGAIGAGLHASLVSRQWYPNTDPGGGSGEAAVYLMADSGWLTEVPVIRDGTVDSVFDPWIGIDRFWNSTANLRDRFHCAVEPIEHCYRQEFFSRSAALVSVPALYLTSIYSLVYIGLQGQAVRDVTLESATYMEAVSGSVRRSLRSTRAALADRNHTVIVGASCTQHAYLFPSPMDVGMAEHQYDTVPLDPTGGNFAIFGGATFGEGVSFYQIADDWLRGEPTHIFASRNTLSSGRTGVHGGGGAVDTCAGLDCNPTCPFQFTSLLPEGVPTMAKGYSQPSKKFYAVLGCVYGAVIMTVIGVWLQARRVHTDITREVDEVGVILLKRDTEEKHAMADEAVALSEVRQRSSSYMEAASDSTQKQGSDESVGSVSGIPFLAPGQRTTLFFWNVWYWPAPLMKDMKATSEPLLKPTDPAFGKALLSDVSGVFHSGTITALMGSSGSGKTTLLDILSGSRRSGAWSGTVSGSNNEEHTSTEGHADLVEYVKNEDIFIEGLTVKETITNRLLLTSQRSSTNLSWGDRFWGVVTELELTEALDVPMKRCSSGQRRRVSVALALITGKPVIFLDEPTSGLDSHVALQLITLLHSVSRTGRTIVLSIHQPRSEIMALFDRIYLIRCGKLVYFGSPAESTTLLQAGEHLAGAVDALGQITPSAAADEVSDEFDDLGSLLIDFLSAIQDETSDMLVQEQRRRASASRATHAGNPSRTSVSATSPASQVRLTHGHRCSRLAALIHMSISRDFSKGKFLPLLKFFMIENCTLIVLFAQFEVESVHDLYVFATVIGLVLLFNSFILEQRTQHGLLSDLPVAFRALDENAYSLTEHILSLMARDVLIPVVLLPIGLAMSYFGVGVSTDFVPFAVTMLIALFNGMAGSSIITFIFHLGMPHGTTIAGIQVFKLMQKLATGILVPISYLPSYCVWLRYIVPGFYATQAAVYINFAGRDLISCDSEHQFESGALACYQMATPVIMSSLGYNWASDANTVLSLGILLALYMLYYSLAWFAQSRVRLAQIKHVDFYTAPQSKETAAQRLTRKHNPKLPRRSATGDEFLRLSAMNDPLLEPIQETNVGHVMTPVQDRLLSEDMRPDREGSFHLSSGSASSALWNRTSRDDQDHIDDFASSHADVETDYDVNANSKAKRRRSSIRMAQVKKGALFQRIQSLISDRDGTDAEADDFECGPRISTSVV